jgi:hypothetical protein
MPAPEPDIQEIEITVSSGASEAGTEQQHLDGAMGEALGWVSASNRLADDFGNWMYDHKAADSTCLVRWRKLVINADGKAVCFNRATCPVTDPQSAGAFHFDHFAECLMKVVLAVAKALPEGSECHLRIEVSNLREKYLIFNPRSASGRRAFNGPQPKFAPAAPDPVEYSGDFLSDASSVGSGVRDVLLSASRHVLRQFEPRVGWQDDEFDFEYANVRSSGT